MEIGRFLVADRFSYKCSSTGVAVLLGCKTDTDGLIELQLLGGSMVKGPFVSHFLCFTLALLRNFPYRYRKKVVFHAIFVVKENFFSAILTTLLLIYKYFSLSCPHSRSTNATRTAQRRTIAAL